MSEEAEKPITLIPKKEGIMRGQHHLPPELFPTDYLKKLKALSVTSAEGFVGLSQADPQGTARLLDLTNEQSRELTDKIFNALPEETRKIFEEMSKLTFQTGALPPPGRNLIVGRPPID